MNLFLFKKIRIGRYSKDKCNRVTGTFKHKTCDVVTESNDNEILQQLKEKFHEAEISRREKLRMLTILLRLWTVKKIVEEFETTRYAAQLGMRLQIEKGSA